MKKKYIRIAIVTAAAVFVAAGFYIYKNPLKPFELTAQTLTWMKDVSRLVGKAPAASEIIPESQEFGLVIPKINVNVPIVADVDGSNDKEYLWKLHGGVAHFKALTTDAYEVDGAFPGETGNIFIFGHSQIPGGDTSKYQGVFNDLPSLKVGDGFSVYYKHQKYLYEVTESKVVEKTEFQYLAPTSQETVTLMTCWPLGFENKRYIIRAKRV